MELSNLSKIFPYFSVALIKDIELNASLVNVSAGDIIMRTGQYIKNTVLIVSGQVKIYRESDDGNEFFMYYLQAGQACALSMVCAAKTEKSQIMAKVVEDAVLLTLPLQIMDKWMLLHKSWYEFVIQTYRTRFEEMLSVIDSVVFRSMDQRLEGYISRQRAACDCNEINLSHQEIANDLSTSREVISRLLKKMENKGFLQLHRNHITILR